MSNLLLKAKNSALVTKARGEIAMIDREGKAQRQAFGVELYDLLDAMEQHRAVNRSSGPHTNNTPFFLGTQSQEIMQTYQEIQLHVRQLQDTKDAKAAQVEHLQANRERARPVTTAREKFIRAGDWVTSNGQETALVAEMVMLDRKIKMKKEEFGLQVYAWLEHEDKGESTTENGKKKKTGVLGGVKAGIANTMSKLSMNERKIQECIERARDGNKLIIARRERKQREIERLQAEVA